MSVSPLLQRAAEAIRDHVSVFGVTDEVPPASPTSLWFMVYMRPFTVAAPMGPSMGSFQTKEAALEVMRDAIEIVSDMVVTDADDAELAPLAHAIYYRVWAIASWGDMRLTKRMRRELNPNLGNAEKLMPARWYALRVATHVENIGLELRRRARREKYRARVDVSYKGSQLTLSLKARRKRRRLEIQRIEAEVAAASATQ